ncbi:MAG: hypothetical protein QOF98_2542 [Streptomyces sp.]|jgi:hypothetical protein|nr:hypothetical protein [Streptomyces sp.]
MTQPQIRTIEGGGFVPTVPLLARPAGALDASLSIELGADGSAFAFAPHGDS